MKVEHNVRTDPEQEALFERFCQESDRLWARIDELEGAYPNEWVSLWDGVVYHAPKLEALFAALRGVGIDPGWAPREFLAVGKPPLLL